MPGSSVPRYAYDDDLIDAARRDGQTRVRVYRLTETVVVLGSGSRPEVELNLDACRADGVPILRRRGGGCAVVLDPGNVIVSVVATGLPFGHHRRHFNTLTDWLIAGLARIGLLGVSQAGICDLVLGDRKVSGACLHRCRDLLYYSASLLVAPDLDQVTRYLEHPPREPDHRRGRSHSSFVGSLRALALAARCQGPVVANHAGRPMKARNGSAAEWVATQLRHTLRPPDLGNSPARRTYSRAAVPLRAGAV